MNPIDFLNLESKLNSEHKAIRDAVAKFVKNRYELQLQQYYREERFPKEQIPELGALGVLGGNLSGYGLPGMDSISYGLVMKELERGDSGLRSFVSVQGALVMFPIWKYGSEAQKEKWLPLLGSGQTVGCFGLTESEGGSDPGSMKTKVEDKGDHYLLNGSKMWITNGTIAKVAIVWAKTVEGIRGFIVDTSLPGFRAEKMQGKLSLRASDTAELYFDNVKLPKESLLPESRGLGSALSCLTQARAGIAWGVLGAAECCFEEALAFAKNRVVFGKTLTAFQLIQRKLSIMATKIALAQLLAFRLAELKEGAQVTFAQVSMAKQNNVEAALEVARMARDILGANGIMDEYRTMRHLCNLETVYTYEGTNDIHLLVVGKELTGTAAFI